MVEPRVASLSARIRWLRSHIRPRRYTSHQFEPANELAARISQGFQVEFPSPPGMPIFAGSVTGSGPIHLRVRVFP
jgi:hypothetical protein